MIRIVIIPNPLQTGDREVCEVEGTPTLLEVVPDWALEQGAAAVWIDGKRIPSSEWERMIPEDGSIVGVQGIVEGIEISVGAILLQAVVSIAASYVVSALFSPPEPSRQLGEDDSPNYGFGGIENVYAEGLPIQMPYGRMRMGGTVISQAVESANGSDDTFLRIIIAFGQGPVQSVGGITEQGGPFVGDDLPEGLEIDGNDARNYDEVEAWVQLGTVTQKAILDFDDVRQFFAWGVTLTSPETTLQDISALAPGFSTSLDDEFTNVNDAYWDEWGARFDLDTDVVDGFAVRLQFPQGFFEQSDQGDLDASSLGYQIRYIALDSTGSPVQSGGYANDGYVRLPVSGPQPVRRRNPGELQITHRFLDPESYDPFAVGTALSLDGSAGGTLAASPTNLQPTSGEEYFRLSVATWIYLEPGSVANGTDIPILGCINNFGNVENGWSLRLKQAVYAFGGQRLTLQAFIYGGSSELVLFPGATANGNNSQSTAPIGALSASDEGKWFHVAFTYRRGPDIARLYINGQRISESGGSGPAFRDARWHRGPLTVGHFPTFSGWTSYRLRGRVDGTVVWGDTFLSDASIAAEYAQGQPTISHIGSPTTVLEYDDTVPVNTAADRWWEDGVLASGAGSGVVPGVVVTAGTGDPKRGRYRVEIVRTNRTSTSPRVQNAVVALDIQSIVDGGIAYPLTPVLALRIRASEQLNSNRPKVTVPIEGRLVPVWDRLSLSEPTAVRQYSRNPAWVCADILTDKEAGMGDEFALKDLYLESFADLADYCDDVVPDGRRTIVADSSDGADLFFLSTAGDDSGIRGQFRLTLQKTAYASIPDTWKPGRFLLLDGFPGTVDGLSAEIDSDPLVGFEIAALQESGTQYVLTFWWDRPGTFPPFPNNRSLRAHLVTLNGTGYEWTGNVTGGRRRYTFNGVYDTFSNPWDALLKVAAVARAVPIREGRRIRMKWEQLRPSVGVVNESSILKDTFKITYGNPRDKPNSLEITILDETLDYEQVPIAVYGRDVEASASSDAIRSETKELFGCTDAGQAAAHARFLLNTSSLLRRTVSFRSGPEAMLYEPGDVLDISHDILPRGIGGRVLADSVSRVASVISDGQTLNSGQWGRNGVVIDPNQAADPFGEIATGRLTDNSAGVLGEVWQDFSPSPRDGLPLGEWCVSCMVRNISAEISLFEISTVDGSTGGIVLWEDGSAVETANEDRLPGGIEIQRVNAEWHFVTVWGFINPSNRNLKPRFSIYPAVGRPLGEFGTGTIEMSQVLAQRGRYGAHTKPRRVIVVDQEVIVRNSTPIEVTVHSSLDEVGRAFVDTSLNPDGIYGPGSSIWLQQDLSLPPLRGNIYNFQTPDSRLQVQIISTTLEENLERSITAIEYSDEAFDDFETVDAEVAFGRSSNGNTVRQSSARLPATVASLTLDDTQAATSTGPRSIMRVAWQVPEDYDPGDRVRVWTRPYEITGPWDLRAEFAASTGGAEIDVGERASGDLLEVSVQVVSRSGIAKTVEGSARRAHRFSGVGPSPAPPTSVRAALFGTRAAIEWSIAQSGHGVEGRRGGWILGDPAFAVRGGLGTGATERWAKDPFGEGVGGLRIATVDQAGRPSAPSVVEPEGQGVTEASDSSEAPVRWETVGVAGWYDGPPFPAGGSRVAGGISRQPDGSLGFGGSAELTGRFVTFSKGFELVSGRTGRTLRRVIPQAVVEASQVHPITAEEMVWEVGDPRFERWSAEGPIYLVAGEEECSLRIEMGVLDDDSAGADFGPWMRYAPGEILCIDIRFRLVVSRPNTSFDVRVTRFHTALLSPPSSLQEPDEETRASESLIY